LKKLSIFNKEFGPNIDFRHSPTVVIKCIYLCRYSIMLLIVALGTIVGNISRSCIGRLGKSKRDKKEKDL